MKIFSPKRVSVRGIQTCGLLPYSCLFLCCSYQTCTEWPSAFNNFPVGEWSVM